MAAARAGKHVFCEKPVGGTPEQTVRIAAAARQARVITGVGYNYRWAPLVLHLRQPLEADRLGQLTNYRFFSMYGSDPMGLLSWRFLEAEGGYGVSSDILSHAVDLATFLVGRSRAWSAPRRRSSVNDRCRSPAAATTPSVSRAIRPVRSPTRISPPRSSCSPTGCRGPRVSRSIVGPESQMAFDLYGTKGAASWNLERMNELQLYIAGGDDHAPRGYTTVFGGDRYPYHGRFVPGDANSIGFEDLVAIEDHEFLTAVAGRPTSPASKRHSTTSASSRLAAVLRVRHVAGRRPPRSRRSSA